MTILSWVGKGTVVGGAIGLVWGVIVTRGLDSVAFLAMGLPPGAVGGLIMGSVARMLPTRASRLIVASVLGLAVGVLYGITPLTPGYFIFTGPSGLLGGILTACLLEDWTAPGGRRSHTDVLR
jgi:hypothetical protein